MHINMTRALNELQKNPSHIYKRFQRATALLFKGNIKSVTFLYVTVRKFLQKANIKIQCILNYENHVTVSLFSFRFLLQFIRHISVSVS
jgi:hypothetical protein